MLLEGLWARTCGSAFLGYVQRVFVCRVGSQTSSLLEGTGLEDQDRGFQSEVLRFKVQGSRIGSFNNLRFKNPDHND